jgi:DNA polymerase
VTDGERQAALEQIADEVRVCNRCRLHQQRNRSVPGEGNPDTEVVFVGEGPGFNEDREGRPFVGRAGGLLVKLLASVGWRREDVFITNVVKCRPPDNRDPEPDEIAACAPYLRRQLAVLDPALVVTLGRFSMGAFMPGARISSAHGTMRPVDPATGAADAIAFAMYHPAAALRSTEVEQTSFRDMAGVPLALLKSREGRDARRATAAPATAAPATAAPATAAPPAPAASAPAARLQEAFAGGASGQDGPSEALIPAPGSREGVSLHDSPAAVPADDTGDGESRALKGSRDQAQAEDASTVPPAAVTASAPSEPTPQMTLF